MKYRVFLTAQAMDDAEEAYRWIGAQSPDSAERWYDSLVKAVTSLKTCPERCPLAPENDSFDEEIRQRLYGKRDRMYRIMFVVRSDAVHILHIRHCARKGLDSDGSSGG